jgi:hypothetical protein
MQMQISDFVRKMTTLTSVDYSVLQKVVKHAYGADESFKLAVESVNSGDASGIVFNVFMAGESFGYANCIFDNAKPSESDLEEYRNAYYKYTGEQIDKVAKALKEKIKNLVG